MKIKMTRPIVFFDLETTGKNPLKDRIVEISYLKLYADGSLERGSHRVKPVDTRGEQVMNDPEAVEVHGITDEALADQPTFKELSQELLNVFADSDIAGYNSNRFDVPMLMEEFGRANVAFTLTGRNVIDVQNIFYKHEPRTLKAAYRFYCDRELTDAHQSSADVNATYEVFMAQLDRYEDMGETSEEVALNSRLGNNLDLAGQIVKDKNGEALFNFGKYKGRKVKEVFRQEPTYYNWIMSGEFAKDTKDIFTALRFAN